jgi:hypothetical protein
MHRLPSNPVPARYVHHCGAVVKDLLDFPPVAGHLGYAAIVDGDGLRVV